MNLFFLYIWGKSKIMRKSLLKITAVICLWAGGTSVAFAQADKAPGIGNGDFELSHSSLVNKISRGLTQTPEVNTLFDIQFNYNATAQRGTSGMAGVVWTGTEFWVSAWAVDSMFTFNQAGTITGRFKVAGVGASNSGVRGMTWDGTHIYAGANSPTVYKIDPVTKTLVSTFTAPAVVRGIAYDSTADGGAGGFWISDYGTDIRLISMTGTQLSSISAANHGLTAMYGIAFDPYTAGGPYIWAFDQSTSATQSDLVRIKISTGMPDAIIHNVMSDIGSGLSSGLAGGLCITYGLDPSGHRSIVGLLQGVPSNRLFAYELNDYIPPAYDASSDTIRFIPAYTYHPLFMIQPYTWAMDITNRGTSSLDTVNFILDVKSGGNPLYTDTGRIFNMAPGTSDNVAISGNYTPTSNGVYNVTGYINSGVQADQVNINDTIRYNMIITDSIMGRDNNTVQGSFGLQAGSSGVLGQLFTTPAASYASSVSFFLRSPKVGDSVNVDLYNFAGTPLGVIATTRYYVFTAADTVSGVFLTLPFIGGPIQLSPGNYFVGVNQNNLNRTLAYTTFNFQEGTSFIKFSTGNWTLLEDANFRFTYILRLNVQDPVLVNVPKVNNNAELSVYPNPASGKLFVSVAGADKGAIISVYDLSGKEMFRIENPEMSSQIDINRFAEGVYVVKLISGSKVLTEKVTIVR
ncbi:MAG: T9SS C-terminal target domain-containing protein [Bacteroidetes bacterium]|nr:MAG: T9SS C-terminal target domain-containing protein [Bacteroidota bacterium]REK03358.1 MAG: T9SS C-terminal target domain-containing protein [Bacteroidota bacterium]REK34531.1 MAG: T9SS C-terminal target domain-containing protein [Bacteroidota bacterium]REK50351.1 MAG: T9SS C-terminal target domain-containing protein [Bacteroidota bacterium]